MTVYYVTPLVNVQPRAAGRCMGDPWRRGDKVALVDTFQFEAPNADAALNLAWDHGNKIGADLFGRTYPGDVRSLMVGDLLEITDLHEIKVVAVDRYGFTPANASVMDMVPLAGTEATSR